MVEYAGSINERFYKVRKALDLTQKEIGKALGITPAYYSKLESSVNPVKDSVVISLCNAFDVNYDYMTSGVEPMFIYENQRKRQLIHLYDQLDESCQEFVLKMLEFYCTRKS